MIPSSQYWRDVQSFVTDEWQTTEEIAKSAKQNPQAVALGLRHAEFRGFIEYKLRPYLTGHNLSRRQFVYRRKQIALTNHPLLPLVNHPTHR